MARRGGRLLAGLAVAAATLALVQGQSRDSTYHAYQHGVSVDHAMAYRLCRDRCMRLPEPRDGMLLQRMAPLTEHGPIWIGIRYEQKSPRIGPRWHWDSGLTATWTHWAQNFPQQLSYNTSCVEMQRNSRNWKWKNRACEGYYLTTRYVCETRPGRSPGCHRNESNLVIGYQKYDTTLIVGAGDYQYSLDTCHEAGRKPVMPKTAAEVAELSRGHHTLRNFTFFLGLRYEASEGTYVWEDGAPVTWTYWNASQPRAGRGRDCVVAELAGTRRLRWATADCSARVAIWVICQDVKKSDGIQWPLYFPGRHDRRLTWIGASEKCQARGMRLPEPWNQQMKTRLSRYFHTRPIWLGLRDEVHGRRRWYWYWQTDHARAAWTNWGPGQPRNYRGRSCVLMGTPRGLWYNRDCNSQTTSGQYVCEMWSEENQKYKKFFVDPPATYEDSVKKCERIGRKLAMPKTAADVTEIRSIARRNFDFFIGLSDVAAEGSWVWADGDPAAWTHWNQGQPRGSWHDYRKKCVVAQGAGSVGGRWATARCSARVARMVVCQDVRQSQGIRWPVYFPARKSLRLTWSGARDRCRGLGMRLAEPRDPQMVESISQYLIRMNIPIWIGLRDDVREGRWSWQSDRATATWTNWARNLPHTNRNLNCGIMGHSSGYPWWDAPCNSRAPHICEMWPNATTQTPARILGPTRAPRPDDGVACPGGYNTPHPEGVCGQQLVQAMDTLCPYVNPNWRPVSRSADSEPAARRGVDQALAAWGADNYTGRDTADHDADNYTVRDADHDKRSSWSITCTCCYHKCNFGAMRRFCYN